MALVTLVGESVAKPGNRFVYLGPMLECRECRLRTVCFNLEQGYMYEIVNVRDQKHQCIERESEVCVAEVEKVPMDAAVPKKGAIEGGIITFNSPKCGQLGCDNYQICHPYGAEDGKKYTLPEVGKSLTCPAGEKMVSAKLF